MLASPLVLAALIGAASPAAVPTMAPLPGMPMSTPAPAQTTAPLPGMDVRGDRGTAAGAANAMDMPSVANVADPMSQEGSGTSWVPRSTPMFGWMRMGGRAMQMTHGAAFPRYVSAGSQRGDRRADAPNWLMFMGTHGLGERAQLGYAAMLSADAVTENQTGYPLLFQTGETAHGVALHDHQHPHDLVSELALDYSARVGRSAAAYLYLGYPGEPALGPPAYMHRRIAYDMPESTVGHHWQDASHIQFGVATVGFAPSSRFKLEASAFTGREPDEIRTNFDRLHLDSYSQRLSWNPSDNAAAEVSYAYVKSPEVLAPRIDQHRLVASLLLNEPLGAGRNWYNGFVFGQNVEFGAGRTSSYLAETDYQAGRNTLFGRFEYGTRTAHDLAVPGAAPQTVYEVGTFALGGVHDLTRNPAAANVGIGTQLTLNVKSRGLDPAYGPGTPLGYQVFLRVRPPDMARATSGMAGMSMGGR